MNKDEFINEVHMIIHSIRLIPNYKSSNAEQKIGKIVREYFANTCRECKEINEKIQTQPQQKEGFFSKLNKLADIS